MKARNGFVSNSSTSSFIIFGFKTTKEIEKKYVDKNEYDLIEPLKHHGFEFIGHEDTNFIGYEIADSGCNSELDFGEFNIEKLIEIKKELLEKFPEITEDKLKIFYGTRLA